MKTLELLDTPLPIAPTLRAFEGLAAAPAAGTPGRLPLPLLGAIGEQVAAGASALLRGCADAQAELERLERWGLQLQEIAKVAGRGAQLHQERVDLGLALLQTLAEWSAEAERRGVDLHGPAASVEVQANPAALKHLLDLLLEHALQPGASVRLEIEVPGDAAFVRVVARVDALPGGDGAPRETLAWQLLVLLARALALAPQREPAAGGERLVLPLPRGL